MKQHGTTILEVLIYLALFGTLMGGVIVASFHVYESNHRTSAIIEMLEESGFIIQKITWFLSVSEIIYTPTSATSSSILSFKSGEGTHINPVRLHESNYTLFVQYGGLTPIPLTHKSTEVSNVLFTYSKSKSLNQSYIDMKYTLRTHTNMGSVIEKNFNKKFIYE